MVGNAPRAASECDERAARRICGTGRLRAGARRLARVSRLRHEAAEPGVGTDDQRVPRPVAHFPGNGSWSGIDARVARCLLESVYRGFRTHPGSVCDDRAAMT